MANYNTGYGYTGQNAGTYYPNQPYSQGYQTAVPMQPQPQQSQNTLLTVLVGSFDEVLNYPVAAGVTVLLVDFNGGSFWLKSTSKTGVPEPLRKFNFEEEIPKTPQNQNEMNFVTKDDFNALSDKLNALIDKLGGDK